VMPAAFGIEAIASAGDRHFGKQQRGAVSGRKSRIG
jgi:hypothetical protein